MRRFLSFLFPILFLILTLFIVLAIATILFIKPYLPFKNYLLGTPKPTSYLILLGNDSEIRANGGFAGSYAKLILSSPPSRTSRPGLEVLYKKPNFDLSFQDIYVPNGQLQGYVAPPAPIQEAFQHGTWQLANADWEPDFATAASSIRWFMEKGGEINPDNLIIMNLTTIKKVLDVVGSFSVPEYEAKITPDNLYLFLQGKAEVNFFPGSTQKKDALTAVGQALKQAILDLPLNKKVKIAQILYQDLVNQNIVINSSNQSFQSFLETKNFAGRLSSNTPDTFLMVEANLGANKANAYVQKQTTHFIYLEKNHVAHQVIITLTNSSPEANPNPPFQYGGDYKAYIRLYLSPNAQNIQIASSSASVIPGSDPESIIINPNISPKFGLTELGFWQTTPAQNQSSFTLTYTVPLDPKNYSFALLKQHGLISSPQTINFKNKVTTTKLENDFFIR